MMDDSNANCVVEMVSFDRNGQTIADEAVEIPFVANLHQLATVITSKLLKKQ
jgi:hypothetical protein